MSIASCSVNVGVCVKTTVKPPVVFMWESVVQPQYTLQ